MYQGAQANSRHQPQWACAKPDSTSIKLLDHATPDLVDQTRGDGLAFCGEFVC